MSKPALSNPDLWREQAYIDGAWGGADSGATTAVHNPATGQQLGTVPRMGTLETRRAIHAANAAWPDWRRQTAKERSAILRRWYELIMQNADDLALRMTLEQGKPLAESLGEVAYGAAFIEWLGEASVSPATRLACSLNHSMKAAPYATSPSDSASGLPCSSVISKARSLAFCMISSYQRRRMAERSLAVCRRQSGQAALAASMARRVSSVPIRGTVPSCWPVAGLCTAVVAPLSAPLHAPSIYACSRHRSGLRSAGCSWRTPFRRAVRCRGCRGLRRRPHHRW